MVTCKIEIEMSATYIIQDALDFVKSMVKNMPIQTVWGAIAQDASNYIWTAAPWRWTIGELSPITLTAASQEFSVVSPPSDFLRLEQCFASDSTTLREIKPVSSLPPSATLIRQPNYVAISAITAATPATIRFDSIYPALGMNAVHKFWAWYKKIAPVLVSDLDTPGALIMDDDYFQIFRDWLLYYAYRYSDDQRAGGAQVTIAANGDRQIAYTGQLAVARASLEELRRQELVLYRFPETPSPMKDH